MKMQSFKLILKLTISGLILYVIFSSLNLNEIRWQDIQVSVFPISLLAILFFFSFFSRSERWRLLMNANNNPKTEKRELIGSKFSFQLLLVGVALNTIMPAGSGDIAKSYFGYKWTGIKERMVAISIIDKLIAIASIFFLAVYAYLFTYEIIYLAASALALIPLIIALLNEELLKFRVLNQVLNSVDQKTRNLDLRSLLSHFKFAKNTLIFSFLISITSWVFTYSILYICMDMVNAGLGYNEVIISSSILTLVRLFPFTFNGLGSDEAAMILLFSHSGTSNESILLGALIYRILTMILPAIVGVLVIIMNPQFKIKKN